MTRQRATRIALALLGLELVALLATGTYLSFEYRPAASEAWADIDQLESISGPVDVVRSAHRLVGQLTVLTGIVVGALALLGAIREHDRRVRTGAAGVVAALAPLWASLTGSLLPWDQLALWAVTVGTNIDGYSFVVGGGDEVRFVIVDGAEVATATFIGWFWTHVALLPVLSGAAGLVLWRRARRTPAGAQPAVNEVATVS